MPTDTPTNPPPAPPHQPPGRGQPPPLGPVLEAKLQRFDQAIEDLAKAAELLGIENGELAVQLRAAGRVALSDQARQVAVELAKAGALIRSHRRLLGVSR